MSSSPCILNLPVFAVSQLMVISSIENYLYFNHEKPVVPVHICNLITWEAKAGLS